MPTLKVDLQEGFSGEAVVLVLNEKEVYRGNPKTRMQIGLADYRTFDLPPQHLKLEVTIPGSGMSKTLELDLQHDVYVGISVSKDGVLSLRSSSEPFGYL